MPSKSRPLIDSTGAIGYRLILHGSCFTKLLRLRLGGGLVHRRFFEKILLFSKWRGATVCATGYLALVGWLWFGVSLALMSSCSRPDWHFGAGGKYNEANMELLRGRGANLDKAIESLQVVVQDNPTYRDSLTLLGKAYYRKGRYYEAYSIVQRALAVNKDDEIAWLIFGLAQIRVGENAKGLETIKGGLTLMTKAMKEDYRGYPGWDPRGMVRTTLNRSVFQALKGLEERESLIQSTEQLLTRIDEEEWFQRQGKIVDRVVSE